MLRQRQLEEWSESVADIHTKNENGDCDSEDGGEREDQSPG